MAARINSRQRILVTVSIGAVVALAGILGQLGPLGWVYDHTFVAASRGLSGAGSGVGSFFSTIGSVKDLSAENAKLATENANLRERLAASADAARENTDLRRELGLATIAGTRQIGADVVAFQPDSYRQFVTIDRGTKQGIAVGQAALSNGVVIGVISSVLPTTAKLQLVTDPEFALAVQDQETGAQGVAHGQLGGGLDVERLAETDTVAPGNTMATSGLGGTVPRGLLVGQVQSVNALTGGIFKTAHVPTTLDAGDLRYVFVVVGS